MRALARRGYRVWLTGRDAANVEAAVAELAREQLAVQSAALDITSPGSVSAFVERIAGEPPIDAVVNNAGATMQGFNADVAQRTVDANYRGAVRLTDALLPRLATNANIVMVSSGMGELANLSPELQKRLLSPTLTREQVEQLAQEFVNAVARGTQAAAGFPNNAYSVSKALLNGFTRVLAKELSGSSQRVNAVCPGWVKTRMGGSGAPRSLEQGTSGIVWAATLDASGPSGGFFRDGKAIAW